MNKEDLRWEKKKRQVFDAEIAKWQRHYEEAQDRYGYSGSLRDADTMDKYQYLMDTLQAGRREADTQQQWTELLSELRRAGEEIFLRGKASKDSELERIGNYVCSLGNGPDLYSKHGREEQ